MSDMNVYTFTGRLGSDAQVSYTPSGTAVWEASVGSGYGYGDNAGTNWLRVKLFGKRAESLGKLDLKKGSLVGISGQFQAREYTDKQGAKKISNEVFANDVTLLGAKPHDQKGAGTRQAPSNNEPFPEDERIPL
jgi:single-strand DNA-binding protein